MSEAVRVPNVSPGAVSGIEHLPIGAGAGDAPEVERVEPSGFQHPEGDEAPAIDPDLWEANVATVLDGTVDEVNDALDGATDEFRAAVLVAEAEGQARKGVLHGRHGTPEGS